MLHERGAKSGREPFTDAEVARLIETAQGDWRGLILCAATTGLRLGDAVSIRWEAIDVADGLLSVETKKTGKAVVLPIHGAFAAWLAGRTRGIGQAPVFPELATQRLAGGRGLSAQFRKLMKAAGVVERVVEREGHGRTGYSKGFHSMRHFFVSAMANAGVEADIRKKLAGHSTAEAHAICSHFEIETLRSAVAKLPSLNAP